MKRYTVGCPGCGSMNPSEYHVGNCKMVHDIVTITPTDRGNWVMFDDAMEEVKNAFFYGANEGFFGKAYDDAWDEYVAEGFPRVETEV